MNVIFDDLANEEFNDAVEYYEFQVEELGKRFKEEIKRALEDGYSLEVTLATGHILYIGTENRKIRGYISPLRGSDDKKTKFPINIAPLRGFLYN